MVEKNILAYFKSPEEAEGAARKLRAMRVEDLSIERVDEYPGDGVERMMSPRTGDFPGLGYLTLGGDFSNNASILAAADVSAHGLSDGGQEVITGRDILLTAVINEKEYEKAVKIIEDAGGML